MTDKTIRLGLVADIHSNAVAFEAVLNALRAMRVDGLIFLGDYLCDFPEPQKTMALLGQAQLDWPCLFICGNRDLYMVNHRAGAEPFWQDGSHKGSLLYTFDNLTDADIDWLATLPDTLTVSWPDLSPFTICHGSPGDVSGWLLNEDDKARKALLKTGHRLLVCGHSHYQDTMTFDEGQVVFVGATGGAIGEAATAHFAVLTGSKDSLQVTHHSVPYDPAPLIRSFVTSGLADRAGCWARAMREHVLTGENMSLYLLRRAVDLAKSADDFGGPLIAERYFEQAAEELKIGYFDPM